MLGSPTYAQTAEETKPAEKKSWSEVFTDPEDGAFDASEWLLDKSGFLPIPIVITEPAVGYGGGVALAFFSESMRDAAAHAKETGHVVPPDIYVLGGGMTENGTFAYFGGGMLSFDEDRWRYRGGVGKVHANLDFYGVGTNTGKDLRVGYTVDGIVSSQQVLRRLGESNTYLALQWIYLSLDTSFETNTRFPFFPSSLEMAKRSSGLGLAVEHDSRDNIFTPSRGWKGSVDAIFYDPDWGSDNRMQSYRAHVFAYFPLDGSEAPRWILGTRVDGRAARGDVPFYQNPFIDMRGIPVGRYQDENVGVTELELRWNVTPRWAAIGFLGAGKAWGTHYDFSESGTEVSKGLGFRYLLARRLGLYVGVDVAKGPEDNAFYIQVGNGWR
ncbi:BamA/TamA family outer membrane protein [Niveibacterium sp. SC-1]|uniref:BamA/TamA family outer membrane protein n=1 Tax=Niveibacterium sp. SC-1 TaxID=3135646 RepID=UPI00311F4946